MCRTFGPGSIFPQTVEDLLREGGSGPDLVLYNISPTTFQPATYPMLTSDESDSEEGKTWNPDG